MKKILFFMLMVAFVASCSKDDAPLSGQLQFDGLSGSELTLSDASAAATISKEVALTGVTGDVVVGVDPSSTDWCSAVVKQENTTKGDKQWTVVITANGYTGNEARKGYVTVKSGIDELTLTVIQPGRGKRVEIVVLDEGQMTKGTAALSTITYQGTTTWDIFRDVNQKPLGDVGQSITYIDGKYYVALNNSKQVKVIEPQTFKLLGTIDYDKPASPRFIARISDTEAIVSDLQRQLTRINYKTNTVVEYISMPVRIEKMTVVGNKLFGAAVGNGVAVFDTNNVNSSSMRYVQDFQGSLMATAKMLLDKNGKLWVMTTASDKMTLHCIDPATERVVRTVEIPYIKSGTPEYVDGCITGTSYYTRIDTDRTAGKLYIFMTILAGKKTDMGAIFTLDVDKTALDPTPYRELPGLGMMYGMGISPDGGVFLCDCLDYTAQRGLLREYKADGSVVSNRVGVYPRMVHFTEYDK